MLWINPNADNPEPVAYEFWNCLDYLLWNRNSDRVEPFEAREYYDPEDFSTRYGKLEAKHLYTMEKSARQKRDKVSGIFQMYWCAFDCLCNAWEEEHLFVNETLLPDYSLVERLYDGSHREVAVLEVLCSGCHREVKRSQPLKIIR